MSGHSKWSQIKHKKAVVDARRGRQFTILTKLLMVESRLCGGDTSSPSLKAVVEKAKESNMPKENIERAIRKGSGVGGETLERATYELYGPGGVAILITTTTDSTNRTVQELKHLVSELGYVLAEPGSAQWAFTYTDGRWQVTTPIPISEKDRSGLRELCGAMLEHADVDDIYTNALEV